MKAEEKEVCFENMAADLKKRNLLSVRERLLQNLTEYSDDVAFLNDCYHLVLTDPLVFQTHNNELLDYTVEHWNEEMYPALLNSLKNNFSRRRYHLAMNLAIYFEEQKRKQQLEQEQEEEVEVKKKKRPKRPKKPKRVLPIEQKYTLTGIGTTTLLLIGMLIQLLLEHD